MNVLFSVILTTYNRSDLLKRAINSVLNQSYSSFELIIINDGSVDDTDTIIKSFTDKRIVYCKHEKNKGVLASKNTGFRVAKGKYVCTLDDDDELLPDALKIALSKFSEKLSENIKILCFDIINAETNKLSGCGLTNEGFIPYKDYLCGKINGDHWLIMDKEVLVNKAFDERLYGYERLLWLKLHREFKIYYYPIILYKAYRSHGRIRLSEGFSLDDIDKYYLAINIFLDQNGEEIKKHCPKKYGNLLFELGYLHLLKNQKSRAKKTLLKSLKFNFTFKTILIYSLGVFFNFNQLRQIYGVYRDIKIKLN